jgi:hypothetical protein
VEGRSGIFLLLWVVIQRPWHVSNARRLPMAYKESYDIAAATNQQDESSVDDVLIQTPPPPWSSSPHHHHHRPPAPGAAPATAVYDEPCRDLRHECFQWAAAQGCVEDPLYMHVHCPVSCQVCHQRWSFHPGDLAASSSNSNDNDDHRQQHYSVELIRADRIYDAVGRHLGVPQLVEDVDPQVEKAIQDRVEKADEYIRQVVNKESRFLPVRGRCHNHHENCAFWAVAGGCEDDDDQRDFMVKTCAPVCAACDYGHVEIRCPVDEREPNGTLRIIRAIPVELDAHVYRNVADRAVPHHGISSFVPRGLGSNV